MGWIDILVFVAFILAVLSVGLWMSRSGLKGKDVQDLFLAGRSLSWWLIGFSLIAANISSEQFVGMSGSAAGHVGLAIASYEWMAAITLVVVAFGFLPYFLRVGIYTMPEFLEYRYNAAARFIMAVATVIIYLVILGAVTYSGAITVQTLGKRLDLDIAISLWQPAMFFSIIAMTYVVCGGLKASVWADLLQGSALIIGGAIIMWFAFSRLGTVDEAASVIDSATGEFAVRSLDADQGPFERFMELNSTQLNMFLPWDDHVLPWTALLLGLWIPNFYYWGLNQYITQRTLGSASLSEGQKGIVFAAYLKLLIPFVVVIPGIIAYNLFHDEMQLDARADSAKSLSMYHKANPDTEFVRLRDNLDDAAIAEHEGPVYLIAVYKDQVAISQLKAANPFVLPLTQADYKKHTPSEFQVFEAKEDNAWKFLNRELAVEIDEFNNAVKERAKESNRKVVTEVLIAYRYDTALGQLLNILPKNIGVLGFVLAALLGAVISSLAAMLNAASSIVTLDIIQRNIVPNASQAVIVRLGRVCVVVFAIIAAVLAPAMGNPKISNSIFTIFQESQGLISPGILAVFVVGLIVRRCPRTAGVVGLLTNIVCYTALKFAVPDLQFLNRMAIVFGLCVGVMMLMRLLWPLPEPIKFEPKTDMNLETSPGAFRAGMVCIVLTLALYVVFSPLGIAR